jgi:hypothetical protein
MKHLLSLLMLCAGMLLSTANAQINQNPLELTKLYFKNKLRNYKSYYLHDKIILDTYPKNFSKKAAINAEILEMNEESGVIAVSIQDKEVYKDAYVFWTNQNGWKIESVQTFWLPSVFHIMLNEYKNLDAAGLENMYNHIITQSLENDTSLTKESVIERLGSISDFTASVNTMKLTLAPDKELVAHFKKNEAGFQALLELLLKDHQTLDEEWLYEYKSPYRQHMHQLLLSAVKKEEGSNVIACVVGGMLKNQAGYFYCKEPEKRPKMHYRNYIMIRALGNGWYLFKSE